MKVIADYDRCEGHGLCTHQAPEIFELDDGGDLVHRFEAADLPANQRDAASSAVAACPVAALRLEA
ncbi:ferredoxin [Mycobacterium sp. URHB0044]|uniref:ferredoxin n=1 Tax=Mycobacterium sp. URHB0044 TaxID=1380386 RepID=UPI00048C0117|nr:ferredoxin [Mycobacterium sp. URHB0044]